MLRLESASEGCEDDLRGPAGGGGAAEGLDSRLPLQCRNKVVKKIKEEENLRSLRECLLNHIEYNATYVHNATATSLCV